MRIEEARAVLGVTADADADSLRAAYRRLLLRTHPDVSGRGDATDATVRLTTAYTVLLRRDDRGPGDAGAPRGTRDGRATPPPEEAPSPGATPAGPSSTRPPIGAVLVDDDTIAVPAPGDETLLLVMETAHALGEISYLDPSAGLVEVIVEFVEAPTSSVLLCLQGRATGVTDVFCTVEPLSGGEAPPADAVTRLVLATLQERSTLASD
ncbi:MAG: J domain-containing protein [Microthrixaceae bacterium]